MQLRGKVAVVTGAQQGIGRAIAIRFAAEGAAVVVNYLDDEATAKSTVAQITERDGVAVSIAGDVTAASDIDRIMDAAEEIGGVDILVNNAGIYPRSALLDITREEWDRVHDVNLKSYFFCAQAAARHMIAAGRRGSIVSIASASAFNGPPLGAHYASSKAGIIGMMRAAAMALAEHGIRANVIAPGLTDTAQPRDGGTEAEIAAMAAKMPLGRIIQPEEIANAAVFLASDEAAQMTGQVVHVNGGQLLG